MPSTTTDHPSIHDLAAFALGKLDVNAAERVQAHLIACAACREIADQTPADSLVGLLQQAGAPRPDTDAVTPSGQGANAPTIPPASADIPPSLRDHPRYRILRLLGRGGMGVVYQAEHRVMERLVAIKVISQALVAKPETLERFHREVRAAAKLDHPNIVKAYDAEQAGDLQLLAMEYVEGKSLADVVHKKGPLPIANACHYVRQAALGLQHAFGRGMVHRDLKPHNLMLTPKGIVKVLDFGLAKLASEQARPGGGLTQDNIVMGTPEYMAPEQALNSKTADIRADIYALGCTLYCLLTGRPPFRGEPLAVIVSHSQEEPKPVESLRPDVPAELAALVARLLAKDPAERPQTPKELAEALLPFTKAADKALPPTALEIPPSRPATRRRRPRRAARRRRWLMPTVVAAVAVLVGGALLAGIALMVKTKSGIDSAQSNPPNTGVRMPIGATEADKVALATLENVDANLRKIRFARQPAKAKLNEHALQELNAAIKAIEAGGSFADREITNRLVRVHKDIADLAATTPNNKSLVEADRLLAMVIGPHKPPVPDKLLTVDLGTGVTMDLVRIPAGTFTMGSPAAEKDYVTKARYTGKRPDSLNGEIQHDVTLSKPFYLGVYPVTVGQFRRFIRDSNDYKTDAESTGEGSYILTNGEWKKTKDGSWHKPGFGQADDYPVTCVSWNDADRFCAWLGRRDGQKYRLPTEAEWEYACRAGRPPNQAFGIGDGRSLSSLQANFDGRTAYGGAAVGPYLGRTCRVGSYPANAFGLFDMHGNVMQWCSDRFEKYPSGPVTDPKGSETAPHRVGRGGGWYSDVWFCRAALRRNYPPEHRRADMGFRVVREAAGNDK